jgi:hypothetical protein
MSTKPRKTTGSRRKDAIRPMERQAAAKFLGCTETTLDKAQQRPDGEKIVVNGIDITIPAFLRRAGKRLSDVQLKAILAAPGWAPIRQKGESVMAAIQAKVSNPDAPVEVMMRDRDNAETTKRFSTLRNFEDWYNPKAHRYLGTVNNDKITVVMMDVETFAMADAMAGKAKAVKPEPTPKKAAPTGARGSNRGSGASTVWANGKEFRSVLLAFETLKLDVKKHKKFRAELKAKKKLAYSEGKKTVAFEYR